ncbi:hypothetical protein C0J52_09498 [Blattella germanica]|nr:hypothetical protein C0J52_09498 [Blattella germanica]
MSEESDQEVLSRLARKGKRHTPRIEDSGSESSDSSFEHRRKRKRALRVESDLDAGGTESDAPLERRSAKKRVPRVVSDEEEDSSGDSDAESGTSGEEEMEDEENGSEADSQSGSEESGSSSCSDWESELEEEELHFDEDEASLASEGAAGSSSSAAAAAAAYMSDSSDGQSEKMLTHVCGECDREDRMLLCDGCDLGYHLECLDPPMDTVPLEEWFCPDCTMSNSVQLAEEVDIQDGELMDLLEDPYVANMPPLRPRVSRLLPRTRQSERVRATMMTRQRQRNQVHNREPAQVRQFFRKKSNRN